MSGHLPPEIQADHRRAVRLEYWTIAWMISVVALMGLVMGGSQAMRTAWIEDILSLVPAIVFLVAARFERKPPTRLFPFGYQRVHSFAFLIAAVALASVGTLLLFESVMTLVRQEHVTVPPVQIFGQEIWLGWLMIAALAYSVVPPVILGRKKLPLARRLQDEVLHTDALMQRADWMTGLAGIAGILGLGLGYWWADAVAAGIISASILHDGTKALRIATAELVDGTPRALGEKEVDPEAQQLIEKLEGQYPNARIRLRKTGRYIRAEVCGVEPDQEQDLEALWPGDPERSWRLAQLSFVPPDNDARAGGSSVPSPPAELK
ncbi:MAG: predicted Co/Zn/Cd cation transporter [uncultured Sphingomonadaceae bacterium]|uniref:Predicted Co/Zn/Cd cation transporter n=1 Tax=uncultured Sphingomonadaceae bacterium TaxID=169976 RepID=A0A6J4TVA6_9SPHN|nr:MAG: predicted Co/Zn/Cd cation transporter [uncultured Sphingomonadaceae bacterium]